MLVFQLQILRFLWFFPEWIPLEMNNFRQNFLKTSKKDSGLKWFFVFGVKKYEVFCIFQLWAWSDYGQSVCWSAVEDNQRCCIVIIIKKNSCGVKASFFPGIFFCVRCKNVIQYGTVSIERFWLLHYIWNIIFVTLD